MPVRNDEPRPHRRDDARNREFSAVVSRPQNVPVNADLIRIAMPSLFERGNRSFCCTIAAAPNSMDWRSVWRTSFAAS